MKIPLLSLLLILALLVGCGLKRNNPLDPLGNPDIEVPKTVTNLAYNTSPAGAPQKYVYLQWSWDPPISDLPYGFKVYRSNAYFSKYEVVGEVTTTSFNHVEDVRQGDYWYRVAAYISYADGDLEGRACDPIFVRVLP
ncbi:MAG: hypothetical protein K0B87_02185 [Candidatus Syntrophosphaera sp.]|nr:hypothetical protein [Candidatus Syntrophosphaera sp.]